MKLRNHTFIVIAAAALLTTLPGVVSADAPKYPDHKRLLYYLDADGREQPVKTAEDWAKRRAHILAGMQEVMGPLPDRSKLPPLDVKILEETKDDGFTRLKLTIAAEKDDRIPAYLLLPTGGQAGGRRPAMLVLHQTSARGKDDVASEPPNRNMAYAPELARRGYVVLCPDHPPFGEYGKYDFAADDYVSGSMKGVFNHMRCVDFLRSRDDVDPERIGVIGHSLGGHNSLFVGAFDERLKVVVTSCGWTPFHDYYGGNLAGWTSNTYMPRIRDVYKLDPDQVPFDFYEVLAAVAPRAVYSYSPQHDGNFDVAGVRKAEAEVSKVFKLLDAAENLKVVTPPGGHDFPPEARQEAFAFVDKALKHTPPAAAAADPSDLGAELPRIAPKEPAEAMETFKTLPGFRIEQVAAEPLVVDPVAMSFDENGRLFVAEMRDYSEQANDHLGTIRLLEDADGDGRFDKSTVYADGLSWPTAVICYGGGVFVGAAPEIFYLKDTDGDGKADEKRVVFTGFKRDNVQGLLNSFRWGLDNRIHGATSTVGGAVRRPDQPEAQAVDLRGRDFSFDPRTLELRPESGGAQHGMSFDDWGRKFASSNSDHIQMVMFEDRYAARNPHLAAPGPRQSIAADGPQAKVFRISPVEPWRIVRTRLRVTGVAPGIVEGGGQPAGYFTGATGVTIYRGDAWPPEYVGQAFVGDVGSNIIHRKVLEPRGVGFVADRADAGREFVASTDTWFRPCQFVNAPDGTLYVADVYREVIEHPHSLPPQIKKHLDLRSGSDRGRIYRIVPDGFKQRPLPRLGEASVEQLVRTLEHPNGWHRDTAARLLFERQDRSAVPLLASLATESKSPLGRTHAMYTLSSLGALRPDVVLLRLGDPHPRVREHAVRLAEAFAEGDPAIFKAMAALGDDEDARVRYQLAFSLGAVPGEVAQEALAKLLERDGGDPLLRFAALGSARDPAAVLARLAGADSSRKVPHRGDVLTTLGSLIGARARADEVARGLRGIEALAAHDAPAASAAVVALREGLSKAGSPLAAKVGQSAAASQLVGELLAAARKTAGDAAAPPAERAEAVRTLSLGSFAEDAILAAKMLDPREPHDVQLAALRALDGFADPGVGAAIVRAWPGFTPRVRSAAADVLFARPERLEPFVAAVEAGKIPAADLDAARVARIEASGADAALVERAKKLVAAAPARGREEVVAAYRPALDLKGDAGRGREVFQKTCAACHRLENVGHEIGPNLAAVQNRGSEAILVNVLDPNREVNPQFVDYLVQTRDGRTVSGMLAAETETSVTLRRAEGAVDTILRADIKRMRGGKVSLMPEGLEGQIDPQGMADLIAYITSVK